MQVLLQRDILGYRTVNTHTHRCLMLKRLNMDVTGIGIGRPLYQTVQQIDDRSIIIRIIDLDFDREKAEKAATMPSVLVLAFLAAILAETSE